MLKGVLNQHIQNSIIKLAIWDDKFLKQTRSIVEPEHFTARESELIVKLVYQYYDTHKESPKHHFRNILTEELNKRKVKDEEFELYRLFLENIDGTEVNRDYVLSIISKFVRRATLREASINFGKLVAEDNFTEAEASMYQALKSGIVDMDLGTNYIHDLDARLYRHENKEYLFTTNIPKIDNAVNGFERKTLVLIIAPLKGGKSWFLVHLGCQALRKGLNIVHLTHEMSARKVVERYDQCSYYLALNDGKIKVERKQVVTVDPVTGSQNYGLEERCYNSGDYKTIDDLEEIRFNTKQIVRFGGNLYIKEYPTGTCTVREVERYLEQLEQEKNFSPDVLITDYGDIMAAEGEHNDERSRVNNIYVRLRGLAVERNILVISASQATRNTIESRLVGAQHVAEDVRKAALADITFTIARTRTQAEIGQGVLRIAATREGVPTELTFGGNLDFGQFYSYEVIEPVEDGEQND